MADRSSSPRASWRSYAAAPAVQTAGSVRAGRLFATALAVATAGGGWLSAMHTVQGNRAADTVAPVLRWAREAGLALPLVLAAVVLAAAAVAGLAPRAGLGRARTPVLVMLTGAGSAIALAAASALSDPVLGLRPLHPVPLEAQLTADTTIALPVTLLVCALAVGLPGAFRLVNARRVVVAATGRPGSVQPAVDVAGAAIPTARNRVRRPVARVAAVSLAFGTLGLVSPAAPASASTGDSAGQPCVAGATPRSFEVTAVDVKIPLNRTGDNDPHGKMLVVNSVDGHANTYSLNTATGIPVPDVDPSHTLMSAIDAVRAEEKSQKVSIGLRDDPIQPLSIRVNEGDCLTVAFTNMASGGSYGLHIDGLAFAAASSGDAIGKNADSSIKQGASTTFRYYVPDNKNLEGSHYVHPGPGYRAAVDHGLFGMLNVEPKGSTYLDASTGNPLLSGWEATIQPPGAKAFREAILQHHEVGNDNERIYDRNGLEIPQVDSTTGSYRPGEFALDYRSEPFRNRLLAFGKEKSHSYSSYTFGDPSTPMPRGYIGDPTKFRISHASGEKFHVYHLHGGGDRWRLNPVADPSWNYADTRLNKHPQNEVASNRLDAQSIGPGESYNLELEGGAGGVQHTVGDLLFHCHISKHYVSGMWSFWRVYNTLQPDFAALGDRSAPPVAVTSDQLVGKNFGPTNATTGLPTDPSQTIKDTTDLTAWVRQQLPAQGVKANGQDPSVYDWTMSKGKANVVLGEPEDMTPQGNAAGQWPNQTDVPKHPGLLATDLQRAPGGTAQQPGFQLAAAQPIFYEGGRPAQLFNPMDGRPAFPVLRTHIGSRPPFSPQGHSGSPLLGEHGDAAPGTQHSTATDAVSVNSPGPIDSAFRADPAAAATAQPTVDPYAYRPDGLCPATTVTGLPTPTRHFNIVAIATPVQRSASFTDKEGKLFTLAQDKQRLYSDPSAQPLALRVNVGDCAKVTLTNEIPDSDTFDGWSKTTIHIHHVQFDVQGSDGVSTGFAYEHSVRPYRAEDSALTSLASARSTVLHVSSVAKFLDKTADGAAAHPFIGIGMGTEGIEVRQVISVDPAANTVTLDAPLNNAHASGEFAGFEFIQYEWYADTQLDNIFWHDHVDGIHGWGHGLVGQLVVEPAGSKYYAPNNHSPGSEIKSGTVADVVTSPSAANYQALLPGHVKGSFRELVTWTINDNDQGAYSTINLKSAPFSERQSAANRFSSYVYGDPKTPMLRGYPGDPLVVRTINVGPSLDTLRFQGLRFNIDNRMTVGPDGKVLGDPGNGTGTPIGSQVDTIHYGMSEKYTLALEGNGPNGKPRPGDYLYFNGDARRTAQGAWGIVRVLPANSADLLPLPDNPAPGGTWIRPNSASAPPQPAPGTTDSASACPAGAPVKPYNVTALDLNGNRAMFADTTAVAGLKAGTTKAEPLVLHVAAGDCLTVTLTNSRSAPATFSVAKLDRSAGSSGVNVGYSPDNTTAPGQTRTYTYFADNAWLGSATIADLAGDNSHDSQKLGLYGAVVVSPPGATFGAGHSPTAIGAQVDVHLPATTTDAPARTDYRDVTLMMADNDPAMSQDFMPYPTNAQPGATNINYQIAPSGDSASSFSDLGGTTDPATPVVKTYAGDPMLVHEIIAPGSEQGHVFTLGGLEAPRDMFVPQSEYAANQEIGPGESLEAWVEGGAGGYSHMLGDYYYGDLRRPFAQVGAWGLIRVATPPSSCTAIPLGDPMCLASSATSITAATVTTSPAPAVTTSTAVTSTTGTGTVSTPTLIPTTAPTTRGKPRGHR